MSNPPRCAHPGCSRRPISACDYCSAHMGDDPGCFERAAGIMGTETLQEGGNFDSISFSHLDLLEKVFFNCSFTASRFDNCRFVNCSMTLSFPCGALFRNTVFSSCKILESAFARSRFEDCRFEDCDIIQSNFNGIKATNCVFEASDLMYSRFVSAELSATAFMDCNLKGVLFLNSPSDGCSFKYCNPEDAIFTMNELNGRREYTR